MQSRHGAAFEFQASGLLRAQSQSRFARHGSTILRFILTELLWSGPTTCIVPCISSCTSVHFITASSHGFLERRLEQWSGYEGVPVASRTKIHGNSTLVACNNRRSSIKSWPDGPGCSVHFGKALANNSQEHEESLTDRARLLFSDNPLLARLHETFVSTLVFPLRQVLRSPSFFLTALPRHPRRRWSKYRKIDSRGPPYLFEYLPPSGKRRPVYHSQVRQASSPRTKVFTRPTHSLLTIR